MSPLCEISFTEAYRKKLQEIRDVVTGKMKIKELHFDASEDMNENYEKKIEDLFETLQKKLLRLDLSEDQSRANIPIEPAEERKVVAAPSTVEVKRFYDGTNYTCNQCAKTVYGDLPFKNHLKTLHNVQSKGLNILEFSSEHKELSYACLVCQKSVNHQFKSIYDHLKRSHSLSIGEYESQYLKPKPAVNKVSGDKPLRKTPVVNLMKLKSSDLKKYSVPLPPASMNSRKPVSVPSSSGSDNKEIHKNMATKESEAESKLFRGNSPVSENSKKRKSPDVEEVPEPVKVVEEEEDDDEIFVVYEKPLVSSPSPSMSNDPPAVSVGRKAKKMKSLYYCPLPDPTNPEITCTFYVLKDGFNDGKAAGHLSKIHKIKKQDMVAGSNKFRRVKTEIF